MADRSVGLVVNGTFEVHPDDRDALIALLTRNAAETQGVEGCISYAFTIDVSNPNLIHNVEAWTDRASLDKHLNSELMRAAFAEASKLRLFSREVIAYTVTSAAKI